MTQKIIRTFVLLAPLAAAGCAVAVPSGPSGIALPKQGEDLGQFQSQENYCRDYANARIGYGSSAQVASENATGNAVAGTAIGAAAGAALGSLSGNVGAGAAVGAIGGLMVGSSIGANNAAAAGGSLQRQYDTAYTQCMVSSGHTVQAPAYPQPAYGYPGYAPYPGYGYGYAPYPYPYPYGYGVGIGLEFGGGRRWHHY